ncbi:MAG: undecaprenyl/decaprenyl-phosphate alpha-N-acetylglucosaminyl 1-phosphate transferase [Chloroflexi bacterium]|nr:undecaprenyl/decaprenyl-phosphate alpha-N-acetylglucosaminyl 1-phosphate transferase [Chloroflexota bacterium]
MNQQITSMAAVFVVALAATFLLTPVALTLGQRVGLVDHPRPGELQRWPVARSGGYGVLAAFLLAVGLSLVLFPRDAGETRRLIGLALGALLIVPIAAVDDFRRLGPGSQFVGQLAIALVTVALGIVVDSVAHPLGGLISLSPLVAGPVTVLWIVGMINTVNFIDTMDGLATGIAAIAATILLLRSVELGQYSIAVLPLALLGVCAGFLPFNFNPARVILGTSGSMLLGLTLAVLAIIGGAKIATAVMVLGLPMVDVVLVIVQRLLRGRSPFRGGDSAHLPHQLVQRGWSQRRVVLTLYAVCAVAGYLSLILGRLEKLVVFVVALAALVTVAVALGWRIHRAATADP